MDKSELYVITQRDKWEYEMEKRAEEEMKNGKPDNNDNPFE